MLCWHRALSEYPKGRTCRCVLFYATALVGAGAFDGPRSCAFGDGSLRAPTPTEGKGGIWRKMSIENHKFIVRAISLYRAQAYNNSIKT